MTLSSSILNAWSGENEDKDWVIAQLVGGLQTLERRLAELEGATPRTDENLFDLAKKEQARRNIGVPDGSTENPNLVWDGSQWTAGSAIATDVGIAQSGSATVADTYQEGSVDTFASPFRYVVVMPYGGYSGTATDRYGSATYVLRPTSASACTYARSIILSEEDGSGGWSLSSQPNSTLGTISYDSWTTVISNGGYTAQIKLQGDADGISSVQVRSRFTTASGASSAFCNVHYNGIT